MQLAPTRLYLDTARLGLMTSSAQQASWDFAKLSSGEGLSLYATRWLAGDSPPDSRFASAFPALTAWSGVNGLADAVRRVTGATATQEVLLASRTTALARFAIRQLLQRCQRPLTVDLLWPGFRRLLIRECRRRNKAFSMVHLRRSRLLNHASMLEIVEMITSTYERFDCDGLMLPAVSHDGVRLPVMEISRAVESVRPPHWIVVDGAQAIGHVACPEVTTADVYLASTHKWLGSGLPLGTAVCGERLECQSAIRIPDPLFRLSQELNGGPARAFGETVNAAPLVTAAAALRDHFRSDAVSQNQLQQQRGAVTEVVRAAGWHVVEPATEFRTRIVLVRAPHEKLRRKPAAYLAERLQQFGVAATCYPGGLVRLSIPKSGLQLLERIFLYETLLSIATPAKMPLQSNLSWLSSDSPS